MVAKDTSGDIVGMRYLEDGKTLLQHCSFFYIIKYRHQGIGQAFTAVIDMLKASALFCEPDVARIIMQSKVF